MTNDLEAIRKRVAMSDYTGQHVLNLLTEIEELRAENERLNMALAGIMTATVQNTEKTVKDRIARGHQYWTQAYEDVCVAIDREMRERNRAERAEKALDELRSAVSGVIERVEGITSKRWADGMRFKDTEEWCTLYVVAKDIDAALKGE